MDGRGPQKPVPILEPAEPLVQFADLIEECALDDQGRPALTINTILPTVNTVIGEQSTRRADVQFKPRGSGDQEIADILTKLYMQISDNNKLEWIDASVIIFLRTL